MYNSNGTFYSEDYSVSFGEVSNNTFQTKANTWTTWHLIPSSRPDIANSTVVTKYIEIPGSDSMLDLTEYLTGKPVYGMRQGVMQFLIANDIEHHERIREKMMMYLHGKKLKMVLSDDPAWYYEGRFTVGNLESGIVNSSISISYQLEPYKMKIASEGVIPVIWDTFNFESDYDYSRLLDSTSSNIITVNNTTSKTFNLYCSNYTFEPIVTRTAGSVSVSFRGSSAVTLNASKTSVTLPSAVPGNNSLKITGAASGTNSVRISWRGGSL